ncbi:ATP-binding cassette domain-containing protein [Brachybacterium sp. EE-P12]|uniref:ATP-binding cassette domain-containing protein n=1 Tax=Candidatus Brachybacterium intestinipullorum TaxID=2838512 RepID=A0A9D2PVX4_9MICO|nr:ATP-binding cassette domain-containing protein [Brachybacterium sp. EE-P12]HJC68159.1 ATP-binding cassette domain-containing protein [Candidatus Brachybacterium intestinipullorum]
MTAPPPLLEIRGLRKSYGTRPVLDGLDLVLPPGIHALLGPNGAGKTTLIKILSTLLPHDGGTVRVLGLDPRRDRRRLQGLLSLTGQFAAVDGALTCTENLEMIGRLFGLPGSLARTRAAEQLERFELTRARSTRAATLSGGMRRKLDIAAGLLSRPRLVILDEPTTGLDTRSRQVLWEEIRGLAAEGTSVLLTTQYLEEADALAEQVHVLDRGRIVAGGTTQELKALVGGAVVRILDQDGAVLEELATTGTAPDLAARLAEAAHRFPTATASIHRPTLDDVFLHLTEAGPSADPDGAATAPSVAPVRV